MLAMPSKGALSEATQAFLASCDLKVTKPNPRQYTGRISNAPYMDVLFQRATDVMYKVSDGTVHLGITGYDIVHEHNSDAVMVLHDALGYGHCRLVVAVPESWVDVETVQDLADVAWDFRERKGRNLRIATKYTSSTRQFLRQHNIPHYTLVRAEGAIEAAPTIGYADVIVDLTQTGTTLRENHLKQIEGGTVLSSQACLIVNRHAFASNPTAVQRLRPFLEFVDAALNADGFVQVQVDMQGDSAAAIAKLMTANRVTPGSHGPTIAPVYHPDASDYTNPGWFTVSVIVQRTELMHVIDSLRHIGGQQAVVNPIKYVFGRTSPTFTRLQQLLTWLADDPTA